MSPNQAVPPPNTDPASAEAAAGSRRSPLRTALAAATLAAVAAGAWIASGPSSAPRLTVDGSRYAVEKANLRYEYNALLGIESITEGRQVIEVSDGTSPLRFPGASEFQQDLIRLSGVHELRELRDRHGAERQAFQRLGYF